MRGLLVVAVLIVAALCPAPARAALTVLDVGTGKRTTLMADEPSDGWTSLRWTADGSALIGVASQELDLSIRRYPVGGGHARLVRRLPEAMDAVLNRDGTSVAALYDHGLRGTGGVIVRDVASGRPHARLPQTAEGDELYESALELTWSPDGRRVAYHAYERGGETVRIANARTGRVLRRLDASRGIYPANFSPAGDRLLYTSGTYSTLHVLDIWSGAGQRIAGAAVAAAWAPAGERIAASTGDAVTITGEDQRIVSSTPTDPMADTLLWSPDGTTLALVLRDPAADDRKTTLAVMTPGSTPRVLVASSRTGFWNLQWSPDGKRLAYTG